MPGQFYCIREGGVNSSAVLCLNWVVSLQLGLTFERHESHHYIINPHWDSSQIGVSLQVDSNALH